MEWQLRIYTIREAELDEWIEEWTAQVAPLRHRFGFGSGWRTPLPD